MDDLLDRVVGAVRSLRVHPVPLESDIVEEIGRLLEQDDLSVEFEVKIAPRCRVDILVEGRVVVEVKRGKPNTNAVARQVARYALPDAVTGVVLVSERGLRNHLNEAYGKPIRYVALSKNWGLTT